MKRIYWSQSERKSVYCDGLDHVTIVNPVGQHSGHPHEVKLEVCDCPQPVTEGVEDEVAPATAAEFADSEGGEA